MLFCSDLLSVACLMHPGHSLVMFSHHQRVSIHRMLHGCFLLMALFIKNTKRPAGPQTSSLFVVLYFTCNFSVLHALIIQNEKLFWHKILGLKVITLVLFIIILIIFIFVTNMLQHSEVLSWCRGILILEQTGLRNLLKGTSVARWPEP